MKKFTEDHEWALLNGDIATVGITDHAQDALGDIVFVDLPAIGTQIHQGDEAAVVESVKAAGEVKSPVSGEVIEVNEALIDNPAFINESAEDKGWIYRIKINDQSEFNKLMDMAAYHAFLG